jgi:uncharacterized membrane protein YeaQ/YmgE (transglycosylase-associated protein family)
MHPTTVMPGLILFILIGLLAGWIAAKIMRGRGFGLIGNLAVGILGGVIGGWLFHSFGGAARGILGSLVTSVIGAIVLLWIVGLIKKK